MTKLFLVLFTSLIGLAYGQMSGVLPANNFKIETDWISIGLILCFFLFLFTVYKNSNSTNDDVNQLRQKDEVQREISEKNNIKN